jgi:hypothetical protein
MTVLDATKSDRLERLAVFVGVAIVCQVTLAHFMPYVAAYLKITLTDSDRALVSQIVSAEINVLLILVGFLFGTSLGRKQNEDTINKQADAMNKAQTALTPIVSAVTGSDKNVELKPGEAARVAATEPQPENQP